MKVEITSLDFGDLFEYDDSEYMIVDVQDIVTVGLKDYMFAVDMSFAKLEKFRKILKVDKIE